jgi:hypothetical protein
LLRPDVPLYAKLNCVLIELIIAYVPSTTTTAMIMSWVAIYTGFLLPSGNTKVKVALFVHSVCLDDPYWTIHRFNTSAVLHADHKGRKKWKPVCMAIMLSMHDTIVERHICTSEWAVSNLLPSKGAVSRIPWEALLLLQGGGAVWADLFRNLFQERQHP